MENKLQEVKNDFTERLFEVIKNEMATNEDLINYYNLFIANIDKHNDLFEDILENGLCNVSYINESRGFHDGDIIIDLNNNTEYNIHLVWREFIVGDYFENEECILYHEYYIDKTISSQTILEENTDKELLQQIKKETENKLKEFKLKYTQQKLDKLLEERKQLNLNIDELQKELNLVS